MRVQVPVLVGDLWNYDISRLHQHAGVRRPVNQARSVCRRVETANGGGGLKTTLDTLPDNDYCGSIYAGDGWS